MTSHRHSDAQVYIGTDGGATTSKVAGVRSDGSPVSTKLLQAPTPSSTGPQAVIASWVDAMTEYLAQNGLQWDHVHGVGLGYEVLSPSAVLETGMVLSVGTVGVRDTVIVTEKGPDVLTM